MTNPPTTTVKPMPKPSQAGRLMLNALSNYARFGVMMVGMLLLTPFIIANVGQSDFGLWMLIISVVGYFELLDCGFATATVKFVGQFEGSRDTEKRNRLASTLLCVYAAMAAVIALLTVGLSSVFNGVFQIEAAQQDKAIWILMAMALKVALNLPLSLFLGVLFGQQRLVAVNITRIIAYLGYMAAVWWSLSNGYGIVQIAALNAGVFVLEHLAFFVICRLRTPDLRLSIRGFDRDVFWKAASFSVFAMITNVSALVLLRTDPIVVKFFLPLSAVALYALALKISEQVLLLTKQLINVFTPLVAQLHGAGDEEGLRRAFISSSKFGLASLAVLSLPLMYWSSEAMELWVGPEFAASGPVLMVLILSMHFRVLQEGATNVLGMTGGHRFVAVTSVISSVINLGLSLLLIQPFGLLGVAAATAISTFGVGMVVVVGKIRRDYNISLLQYCRRVPAPIVLPAAMQLVVCAFLRAHHTPGSLLELAVQFAIASSVFAVAFGLFSMNDEERRFVHSKVSRFLPRRFRQSSSAAT